MATTRLRKRVNLAQQHIGKIHPADPIIGVDEGIWDSLDASHATMWEIINSRPEAEGSEDGKYQPLKRVLDCLSLDLAWLGLRTKEEKHIQKRFEVFGLGCEPDTEWYYDRVLTLEMQELMECHITEIGVEVRAAEALEEHKGIIRLSQLLDMPWDELAQCANSVEQGGIANFGAVTVAAIKVALTDGGFVAPPGVRWVKEQGLIHYIRTTLRKMELDPAKYLEPEGE